MKLFNIINNEDLKKVLRKGPDNYYLTYKVPKRSRGYREINAPQDPLKLIQEQLLYNIYYRIKAHDSAVGFIPGKKMKEGAEVHLKSKVLLNIDLKDFFGTFDYKKVMDVNYFVGARLDQGEGFLDKDDLAPLTELTTFKKKLPQGSPCSPHITNIGFIKTDKQLLDYSTKHKLKYTRYVDDLSFSSGDYSTDMVPHLEAVSEIIKANGFLVNPKKTRILRPHNRMSVTGITVNEKLGVPKWKRRNFRAKIHNLKKKGTPIERITYEKLRGYAEWIKSLNPEKGEQFIAEIGSLNLNF